MNEAATITFLNSCRQPPLPFTYIKMIDDNTTTIGIDLGTSHCTAAVWDSTRGHPKWMRLGAAAYAESNKDGRIMPSAVLFLTRRLAVQMNLQSHVMNVETIFPNQDPSLVVCVGAPAVQALELATTTTATSQQKKKKNNDDNTFQYPSYKAISAALVTSAKRLVGLSRVPENLQSSLSLETVVDSDNDDEIGFKVQPLGYGQRTLVVTPSQATSILLLTLRWASQAYLKANLYKKKLQIPGASSSAFSSLSLTCTNAVIGVPAHYNQAQRQVVLRAANKAGFTGKVTLLTESTAAAMAYGIFVSRADTTKTLLVFDSGGGTTDVTIATMATGAGSDKDNTSLSSCEESQRFQVVVTEGDARLGGDDMDAALLALALQKVDMTDAQVYHHRRQLLHACRRAKERLCGDVDHGYQKPESSVTISLLDDKQCNLTQDDLEKALGTWMERGKKLVRRALERYAAEKDLSYNAIIMNEVILVGGATRVPAVRNMLRQLFPPPNPADLCLSVNAMAAVAQGAAIQAAIQSGRVPQHEVRSAMMLDTVPHAIGVLLPESETFVEIIPRDAPLPAFGAAMFQMASPQQPGVTVVAVEQVEDGQLYPKLGEFTFLLARLPETKVEALGEKRSIEIRMSLFESGDFRVSYFDENDPEHAGLKPSACPKDDSDSPVLAFQQDEDSFSFEQIMLLVSCIVLLFAYVAAKIYFQEELSAKSE